MKPIRIEQLPCVFERDVVVPLFIEEKDHPWLQRLIERAQSAEGLRAADVDEHLLAPLPVPAPASKQRLAAFLLQKQLTTKTDASFVPKEARELVFTTASSSPPPVALTAVASALGVSTDELRAGLFADLPGERVVGALASPPSPGHLASKANLWLAQAFVSRATKVKLDVKGTSRLLVLNAKSKGLLCTITGSPDGSAAVLELSGPLSLFRRTRLYGRALASLLPALPFCDRFVLDADVVVAGRAATFRIGTGAPIAPSEPPKRFDSKAEERFAKDFDKRHDRRWRLVREPRPVVVGDALAFPDFALEPIAEELGAKRPVYVELVGFWTPQYLEEKLARYRKARLFDLVLCVDDQLGCADGSIPEGARVVRFHRKVDVDAVIAAAESLA